MEEALTTLLAGVASGRRYWVTAPEGTDPAAGAYVVLNRISGVRDYHMDGASGVVTSRVQADCYGANYATAKATARAVTSAVSGYRGASGGITIHGIFIDAERDLPGSDQGAVSQLFRVSLDLMVHHDE